MTREEVEFLEPPGYLVDMRKIYEGVLPATDRQKQYYLQSMESFRNFSADYQRADKDWREAAAKYREAMETKLLTVSNLDDDDGLQRAVGACRQWLKGHKDAESVGGLQGAAEGRGGEHPEA